MDWISLVNTIVPIIGASIAVAWRVDNRIDKVERAEDRVVAEIRSLSQKVDQRLEMLEYRLNLLEGEKMRQVDQTTRILGEVCKYLEKFGSFSCRTDEPPTGGFRG